MFGPSAVIDVSCHKAQKLLNTKKAPVQPCHPACISAINAIWHQITLVISHCIGNTVNVFLLQVANVVIIQESSPWGRLLVL